jgi:GNAT superfamily N-acetyltransferase
MGVSLSQHLDAVDWAQLAHIFERAPLGSREADKLQRAFGRSYRVCFAYDGGTLVGAGRIVSDGEYYESVYDMVVLPEYQGQGMGTQIIDCLLNDLDVGTIMLVSVPGKESFYRKHVFDTLRTGMARYRNQERAREAGYLE